MSAAPEQESAVPGQRTVSGGQQSSGLVPFPRLCSVVGYLGICLLLLAVALEVFSYITLTISDRYTASRKLRRFGVISCHGTDMAKYRPLTPMDVISAGPVFDEQ